MPETMMPMPAPMQQTPRVPPGSTAPATVSPSNDGIRMQARSIMGIIGVLAKKAAGMFGPGTREESDALKIATLVSKAYGAISPDITKQQVKLMGEQALPVPNAPSPEQMGAFQSAVKSRLPQPPQGV